MLRGINKARADDAYRLLQCLTVAVRPLYVEELAEILAFDFEASSSNGIPTLKEDWRWDDEEEAVLSTCSSFIAIVRDDDSRIVQFSHFSVKEFLTSPRLAQSPHGDVSQFHIHLDLAHTIMAQACLGILLRTGGQAGDGDAKGSPLVQYAAEHWVEHARFENVSSRVRDGMDDLFDNSKPHFAAWLQVHDMDKNFYFFSTPQENHSDSPLYYASLCGFYDLAERLITKHPDQVNPRDGDIPTPLTAALYHGHFRLANLLHKHGADVDCRGKSEMTPLLSASMDRRVDVMRWLLDHGANANAQNQYGNVSLHWPVAQEQIEAVQLLLEHNADTNLPNFDGRTPLYSVIYVWSAPGMAHLEIAQRLLEHGADPNLCGDRDSHSAPLHEASSRGLFEIARLLLSYGAKVDAKDREGRTPFQVAASKGHHEITKLLFEHGAVPPP